MRASFWANLKEASGQVGVEKVDEEKRKLLAQGQILKTKEETTETLRQAREMDTACKWNDCAALLTAAIPLAYLDDTLLGELYYIRGKMLYLSRRYWDAIRDLSMAKSLFNDGTGDCLFYRMRCYIDLGLTIYATVDYDHLVEQYPEYPSIKTYKSKATGPVGYDLKKSVEKIASGRPLPLNTKLEELVKITIAIALMQDFGFEELGQFIYMVKMSGYEVLANPKNFGCYLRDVFGATEMDDISEVFTHFLPEHEIPPECNIDEVIDAVEQMGAGCHLVHQIGFAMCFSLAWTTNGIWNLVSTLFSQHLLAKLPLQRALWHEYFQVEVDRMGTQDDDVSYTCNGGIGEIPPPTHRLDYLYVNDFGGSDYVRLHAVATAHKATAVLAELEKHAPLNVFHTTLAPMIFSLARDAMPESVKFVIERGADVNIVDAAEESPLDAAKVALEFRMDMLHDHGFIVPVEDYNKVVEVLKEAGAESHEDNGANAAREAFSSMFGGGDEDDEEGEEDEEDDGHGHHHHRHHHAHDFDEEAD